MQIPDYEEDYLLFGMLFVLGNKLQAIGDVFFDEISSKQWFMLVCLELLSSKSPTINELSEVMGSSHQNVKQIALKLEKSGFVKLEKDEEDRRKLRISMTDQCKNFGKKYEEKEKVFMQQLFSDIPKEDLSIVVKTLLKLEENMEDLR